MRVLYAYNESRYAGGANNAPLATMAVAREHGLEAELFTRSSRDLPPGLKGRIEAGLGAIRPPDSVKDFDALLASFRPDVVHVHQVYPQVSPRIPQPVRRPQRLRAGSCAIHRVNRLLDAGRSCRAKR